MTMLIRKQNVDAPYEERWIFIEEICDYFYKNRNFYRKVFQIRGQNSIVDYIKEYITPLLEIKLRKAYKNSNIDDFSIHFYSDALLCAVTRWLSEKDCMTSGEFVEKLKYLIENSTMVIHPDIR
jgi:hypothetical protein